MWNRIFKSREPAAPKTRFKRLDEFYTAIHELGARLNAEGHPNEAETLDTLMYAAWTTGSELLGELIRVLGEMKGDYSKEIREEIRDCQQFARHHRGILGIDR